MHTRFLAPLFLFWTYLAQAQSPAFTASSVVNMASNVAGPLAPGELVTIFGSNLGGAAFVDCIANGVLPVSCGGTAVLINAQPVPLVYVSGVQLSFQVPYDLTGSNATVQVTRTSGGQTLQSAVVSLAAAPAAPGLTLPFLSSSFATLSVANPAHPGETVTVYGSGFGATKTPLAAGLPAKALIEFVAPVTVTVAGQDAVVQASVLAFGLVGLAQVVFTVPQAIKPGQQPVVVTVGGVASPLIPLPVGAPKPTVSGVSNNASGALAVTAGSWVSVYGTNLASTTRLWRDSDFTGNNLPTSLDGVSVKVNGKPAYVYYISPTLINVLSPADTATGTVTIEVTNAGGSATGSVNVQTYAPGLFTFNGKYAAAVHSDRVYVAPSGYFGAGVASRPAAPGETILIYGTGFGPTSPAISPAQIMTGSAPLADLAQFQVTIGGVPATVEYAGLVANGEYQFNVVVPPGADGDQPIVMTVGGVSSAAGVLLPIRR